MQTPSIMEVHIPFIALSLQIMGIKTNTASSSLLKSQLQNVDQLYLIILFSVSW